MSKTEQEISGTNKMLELANVIDTLTKANISMLARIEDDIEVPVSLCGYGSSRHDSVSITSEWYVKKLMAFNKDCIEDARVELREILK